MQTQQREHVAEIPWVGEAWDAKRDISGLWAVKSNDQTIVSAIPQRVALRIAERHNETLARMRARISGERARR